MLAKGTGRRTFNHTLNLRAREALEAGMRHADAAAFGEESVL
jgi:hypothetical protein